MLEKPGRASRYRITRLKRDYPTIAGGLALVLADARERLSKKPRTDSDCT